MACFGRLRIRVSTTGAARIAVRADMVLRTDLHFHRVPDFFLTP